VVLVFGATGALGSGVAAAFAAAGAVVTGADRRLPAGGTAAAGVSSEAVDVLDDAALGALNVSCHLLRTGRPRQGVRRTLSFSLPFEFSFSRKAA
jgi:nucleoside-diphosphate-sugar epimerase